MVKITSINEYKPKPYFPYTSYNHSDVVKENKMKQNTSKFNTIILIAWCLLLVHPVVVIITLRHMFSVYFLLLGNNIARLLKFICMKTAMLAHSFNHS